jgi:hypothetical protein
LKTTAEFWEPIQAVSEGQKGDLNPEPEEILPLPLPLYLTCFYGEEGRKIFI